MNLTGQFIKGTGAYEVKEIAPPAVGNLATNGDFATGDFTGWSGNGTTEWSVVDNKVVASGAGFRSLTQSIVEIGKYYLVELEITSYTSGKLLINQTIDYYFNEEAGRQSVIYKADSTTFTLTGQNAEMYFTNIIITELPEGYPLLDVGSKYLECTSAGSVAFPSSIAYGTWEFSVYKGVGSNIINIRILSENPIGTGNRYTVQIANSEGINFFRDTTLIISSISSYIENNTWYRFKVTRTLDSEFSLYIKGGDFGTDDWTLVSTTGGTGSNPRVDNTYTESQYLVLDLDVSDRIANISISNQVEQ